MHVSALEVKQLAAGTLIFELPLYLASEMSLFMDIKREREKFYWLERKNSYETIGLVYRLFGDDVS